MKKYCLIGGAGFVGSHLAYQLYSKKEEISVIGRSKTPRYKLPPTVHYFSGDYGNKNFLVNIIKDADYVINLAYPSFSQVSFDDPLENLYSNLLSNINLFEVISKTSINKLIICSSGGTVYGKTKVIPIKEDHPTNPISPYGINKLLIEKYAKMYHELKDLPVICVRPGNIYGEGQRPYLGQGFISTAIASIMDNREIILYGQNGTIRDYIHVTDVVKAISSIIDKGELGSVYNIGSGVGNNNREILDILCPFAQKNYLEIKLKILPERKYDVPANILDCQKLFLKTGWKPEITLKDGLKKVWDFMSIT